MGFFDFFKKTKLISDSYESKIESIDDIQIGKTFERITKEQTKDVDLMELKDLRCLEDHKLRTKLSKEQTIELAKVFFKSFHSKETKGTVRVLENKNKNIQVEIDSSEKANGYLETPNGSSIVLKCTFAGDLRDLYSLVHETTHTMDITNGDTSTRRVLGEVAPSCMESLLDNYLLSLDNKEKYGFNEQDLKNDIRERKIIRFIEHYENARGFNNAIKSHNRNLVSETDLRYMLAEIYQSKFNEYDSLAQKKKIIQFVKSVSRNDFEQANNTFGMDFKNKTEEHILSAVGSVKRLLHCKSRLASISNITNKNENLKYIKKAEEKENSYEEENERI